MKSITRQKNGINVFLQTGIILLIAVVVGLLVNLVRPDRLSLVADMSLETRLNAEPGKNMLISLDEARDSFFSQKAVFIDSRSPEIYQEAHIKGARNLPWEEVEKYFDAVMSDIPEDALIIAYCDGEHCSQSSDLAVELFYSGYENVRVLVNGWSLWLEHRLPTEMAPMKGKD